MLFDALSLFSEAQAVTSSAPSTNSLDTGVNGTVYGANAPLPRDQGKGYKVPLLIQVVEDFAGLTSLTVAVEGDDSPTFAAPKTLAATAAIPLADLKAGKQFALDVLPLGSTTRYLRLKYTVTGTASAGKITAGVTLGNQTNG